MTTIYETAYSAALAAAQDKANAMHTPDPFVKLENWPDVRRGIVFDVALEAGHNTAPVGAGSAEWDEIDRAVGAAVHDALAIRPPHHLGTESRL